MKVAIMRRACLPEDEGRDELIKICEEPEAKRWIAEQRGYFSSWDYYIARPSK